MNTSNESATTNQPAIKLKTCPFCASQAEVKRADDGRFGVQCRCCRASVATVWQTADQALRWWNLRQSGPSYHGGLATKGISTAKKRRACRRNLKRARQQKQLQRIRRNVEEIMPQLQAARAEEMAEAQTAAAQSRARLAALLTRHSLRLG
ncbi:MAG TPA: Lar family restriction alleviation protein [Verrucomicrobiae bacterium]|nr:Lar family restriction alleviation protein [Verrucomicrobiae bacterium]